jgi:superfamily II DNA or RNA helicase
MTIIETMQPPSLRGYQTPLVNQIKSWIAEEKDKPLEDGDVPGINRNAVVYAPCGAGKTVISAALMINAAKQGVPSMFLMNQDNLVTQTVRTLERYGVKEPRVIKAGPQWKHLVDKEHMIMVGGIQTMASRGIFPPEARLILVDECHTSLSAGYRKVFEAYPEAWIVGLTASPLRTKKTEGLKQRYSKLIVGPTWGDLIDIGRQTGFAEGLVPFQYYGFAKDRAIDVSDVRTTGGDYNQGELQAKCDTPGAVSNSVEAWKDKVWAERPGDPRRTIAFCTGIDHSLHTVDQFNREFATVWNGPIAMHIDGDADFDERQEKFELLRSGRIRVLSSVALLTTGFDVAEVEAVLDCAPTKSLTLHLQKYGRGSRTSPNIGKVDCMILDQAGNVVRHGVNGFVEDYVPIELDEPRPPGEGDPPMKMCPPGLGGGCGNLMYAFQMTCPKCGYEFPQRELVERVGEMVALLKGEDKKHHRTYVRFLKKAFADGYLPEWANYKTVMKMSGSQKPASKDWEKYRPLPEWRMGAVFDGNCNRSDVEAYCGYLVKLVDTREEWFVKRGWKTATDCGEWALVQLKLEFGKDVLNKYPDIDQQLRMVVTQKVSTWGAKQLAV